MKRVMLVCLLTVVMYCHCQDVLSKRFTPFYIISDAPRQRSQENSIRGFSPDDIKSFYGFSTSMTAGSGSVISIVAAYESNSIEEELEVYSRQFGLPSCTTLNGCFKKVGQNGSSVNIPIDPKGSWLPEISLDVQIAHAISPGARILLVLANSDTVADMLVAIQYAKLNSNYVSMSFGFEETPDQLSLENIFVQPGVSFFAASGDSGATVYYPSSSPNVVAVGGTTISITSNRINETGWILSGGGQSKYSSPNRIQQKHNLVKNFLAKNPSSGRLIPDVSFIADPQTGMAIYTNKKWQVMGGTSASCPILAARASQTGTVVNAEFLYNSSLLFRDITVGRSVSTFKSSDVNNCYVGYDLVTGLGSWIEPDVLNATFRNSAIVSSKSSTLNQVNVVNVFIVMCTIILFL
ncbi:pseudomonalisin [Acrasis kona]|uniref:Pseudomonalisin n=1 Tax=Acrasis kona TaxID=1008807 RepID=A0AAW2Z528_9EUKA